MPACAPCGADKSMCALAPACSALIYACRLATTSRSRSGLCARCLATCAGPPQSLAALQRAWRRCACGPDERAAMLRACGAAQLAAWLRRDLPLDLLDGALQALAAGLAPADGRAAARAAFAADVLDAFAGAASEGRRGSWRAESARARAKVLPDCCACAEARRAAAQARPGPRSRSSC